MARRPSSDQPAATPLRARRRAPASRAPGGSARGRRRRVVETVLVAIGCVILTESLIGERGLVAMMRARQEYRAEVQLLEAARAEHVRLREAVRRLREDPAAIEDLARRELGLIKPGEKLFTIRDLPPKASGR